MLTRALGAIFHTGWNLSTHAAALKQQTHLLLQNFASIPVFPTSTPEAAHGSWLQETVFRWAAIVVRFSEDV